MRRLPTSPFGVCARLRRRRLSHCARFRYLNSAEAGVVLSVVRLAVAVGRYNPTAIVVLSSYSAQVPLFPHAPTLPTGAPRGRQLHHRLGAQRRVEVRP